MIVEILTLEEVLFSQEAVSVVVPGEGGRFEMLDNHAPIISILKEGLKRKVKISISNSFFIFVTFLIQSKHLNMNDVSQIDQEKLSF